MSSGEKASSLRDDPAARDQRDYSSSSAIARSAILLRKLCSAPQTSRGHHGPPPVPRRPRSGSSPAARPASAGDLAKILVERGYRVVATARDPEKLADLVAGHAETALAVKLDVDQAGRDRGGGRGSAAQLRAHRRARQQCGLRLSRGGRGGRRRRHPRHVRDEFFRPRRHDAGRPAGHAGAKIGRDRQHLLDGRLHRLSGLRLLCGDEIRGRGPVRIARQGGRAVRDQGPHRRARPVPHRLGGPVAEDAEAADRRLRGDGDRAPPPDPGLQRHPAGRSGARRRGDHRDGRAATIRR